MPYELQSSTQRQALNAPAGHPRPRPRPCPVVSEADETVHLIKKITQTQEQMQHEDSAQGGMLPMPWVKKIDNKDGSKNGESNYLLHLSG